MVEPMASNKLLKYHLTKDYKAKKSLFKNKGFVGKYFIYPSFLSTSLLYSAIKNTHPNPTMLRIRCLKDAKGAFVEFIARRNEYEMLLPPNQAIYVDNFYYNKDGIKIYECVIVDKGSLWGNILSRTEHNYTLQNQK